MDVERIRKSLSGTDPLEPRLQASLGLLTQYLGAERGCMMVTREGRETILFAGDEDLNLKFPFSKSVVSETMTGNTGLVSFYSPETEADPYSSLTKHRIRAALCVPILGPNQEDFGVVYFDTRIDSKIFSDKNLEEVSALAKEIGAMLH